MEKGSEYNGKDNELFLVPSYFKTPFAIFPKTPRIILGRS